MIAHSCRFAYCGAELLAEKEQVRKSALNHANAVYKAAQHGCQLAHVPARGL
jgi:hypothetical protein